MDEVSRKLNILLNVKKSYVPKAEYIFRAFCKTVGLQPEFFYGFSLDDIHIYYGIETKEDYPIEIRYDPNTALFYENRSPYETRNIHYYMFHDEHLPFLFSRKGPIFHYPKDKIILRKDIIASAFYFLSCWDEYTHGYKQKKRQLAADFNTAITSGFADLPVVDRYCEIFLYAVRKVMVGYQRENKFLTDTSLSLSLAHISDLLNYSNKENPPPLKKVIRLIEAILNFENKKGISSTFFLPLIRVEQEIPSSIKAVHSLIKIDKKNKKKNLSHHDIAIFTTEMPKTDAINNSLEIYGGDDSLVSGFCHINLGSHYSKLLDILEETSIAYDCSLFFNNRGYRAGTALPYTPFNIRENRPYPILEIPPAKAIKMSDTKESQSKDRTFFISIIEKIFAIDNQANSIKLSRKKKSLYTALHLLDCIRVTAYRKSVFKKIYSHGTKKDGSFITLDEICDKSLT